MKKKAAAIVVIALSFGCRSTPSGRFRVVMSEGATFFDDFSSYKTGTKAPFGRWFRAVNEPASVVETSQPDGEKGNVLCVKGQNSVLFLRGEWSDIILEVNQKNGQPEAEATIYLRVSKDGSQGYYVKREKDGRLVRLFRFSKGKSECIAEGKWAQEESEEGWVYYRIEAHGNRIRLYLNGEKVIDAGLKKGWCRRGHVGLGSARAVVYFDNLRIVEQP